MRATLHDPLTPSLTPSLTRSLTRSPTRSLTLARSLTSFSDRYAEFAALDTEVLGCSVDSEFSHLAWVQTDRKEGGLGDIAYPIVSDLKKEVRHSVTHSLTCSLTRLEIHNAWGGSDRQ